MANLWRRAILWCFLGYVDHTWELFHLHLHRHRHLVRIASCSTVPSSCPKHADTHYPFLYAHRVYTDFDDRDGSAEISIDDGTAEVASSALPLGAGQIMQKLLWSKVDLDDKEHTLKMVHSDTSGKYVTIDYFRCVLLTTTPRQFSKLMQYLTFRVLQSNGTTTPSISSSKRSSASASSSATTGKDVRSGLITPILTDSSLCIASHTADFQAVGDASPKKEKWWPAVWTIVALAAVAFIGGAYFFFRRRRAGTFYPTFTSSFIECTALRL